MRQGDQGIKLPPNQASALCDPWYLYPTHVVRPLSQSLCEIREVSQNAEIKGQFLGPHFSLYQPSSSHLKSQSQHKISFLRQRTASSRFGYKGDSVTEALRSGYPPPPQNHFTYVFMAHVVWQWL